MPRIPSPSAFFKRYTFATDAPEVDTDVSYVQLWMFAVDDGDPTYLAFSRRRTSSASLSARRGERQRHGNR